MEDGWSSGVLMRSRFVAARFGRCAEDTRARTCVPFGMVRLGVQIHLKPSKVATSARLRLSSLRTTSLTAACPTPHTIVHAPVAPSDYGLDP
jgi:hypothetical protein